MKQFYNFSNFAKIKFQDREFKKIFIYMKKLNIT